MLVPVASQTRPVHYLTQYSLETHVFLKLYMYFSHLPYVLHVRPIVFFNILKGLKLVSNINYE
jgi:hypothetical protein